MAIVGIDFAGYTKKYSHWETIGFVVSATFQDNGVLRKIKDVYLENFRTYALKNCLMYRWRNSKPVHQQLQSAKI